MFSPLSFEAKSSSKRKLLNSTLIIICAFFLWASPSILLIKLFFSFILFCFLSWLFIQERKVTHFVWKELDDIQISVGDKKSSYKLSSCITTSWYCVWVLTSENGGYKKLHLWFDQLDEQNLWQLRRNLVAWKEKST